MTQEGNRIEIIASNPNDRARGDLCLKLERSLANAKQPLNPREITTIFQILGKPFGNRFRACLWRILLRHGSDVSIREFAEATLGDPSAFGRPAAMQYLRERFPEGAAEWEARYRVDPDAGVRYEALLTSVDSEPDEILDRIVDLLPDLPFDLRDDAEFLLLDRATARQLARLRLNDNLRGGGTLFARVARELEAKLAQRA